MPAVRLVITGRVQGVGYRDFVRAEAQARNLAGWVRNRRDGSVEAIVNGAPESVEELIAACWRGPRASNVADVRTEALEAGETFASFTIYPTE
jgi:acylphosphatase